MEKHRFQVFLSGVTFIINFLYCTVEFTGSSALVLLTEKSKCLFTLCASKESSVLCVHVDFILSSIYIITDVVGKTGGAILT